MNKRIQWTLLAAGALILAFCFLLVFIKSQQRRQPVTNYWRELVESRQPEVVIPDPTFDSIFLSDHSWVATLSAERTTTLLVTGDVLTARSINAKTVRMNDFTWPWQKTADQVRQADITFINLETPLIPDCPTKTDGMVFCGDVRQIDGLLFAGVDVVNLANNHMGNYQQAGVDSTIALLEQTGIKTAGINAIPIIEHNGVTFAFLGFNEVDRQPGVPYPSDELITSQISEAKVAADVVVVQFHWGNEYTYRPSTNQKRLAHLAIDSGADLIVSNHPHWWQPLEKYNDAWIMYSHGNFIFDQMWSLETRQGLVGIYTFYDDQLVDIAFLPVLIEDYGQPTWVEGPQKEAQLLKLQQQTLSD